MFKKSILAMILTCLTAPLHAGTFYLGPGLQYESIAAETSYQAISPRITFGYGGPLNPAYGLAAELFGAAGTIENHPTDSGLKNTPNVGLSILPSILFGTHSFGFARLGLITASFSAQNTNAWGAQAGLGFETPIMRSVNIRAEYIYTAYENVSMEGSPKSSAFVMGFMYYFS
jgi:hypothetical protein